MYVKTNVVGYYKDSETGMIVNRNEDDFKIYQSQKTQYKELLNAKAELSSLKQEMQEMREMFLTIMNKKDEPHV